MSGSWPVEPRGMINKIRFCVGSSQVSFRVIITQSRAFLLRDFSLMKKVILRNGRCLSSFKTLADERLPVAQEWARRIGVLEQEAIGRYRCGNRAAKSRRKRGLNFV